MPALSKPDIRCNYLQERIKIFAERFSVADRGKAQTLTNATFLFEKNYITPFVSHPTGSPSLICPHKIIAATCAAIMAVLPFRHPRITSRYEPSNLRINAAFALDVAVSILSDWSVSKFPTVYRRALLTTYEEHKIWLTGLIPPRRHEPETFPYFLVSQFWSAIEVACCPVE